MSPYGTFGISVTQAYFTLAMLLRLLAQRIWCIYSINTLKINRPVSRGTRNSLVVELAGSCGADGEMVEHRKVCLHPQGWKLQAPASLPLPLSPPFPCVLPLTFFITQLRLRYPFVLLPAFSLSFWRTFNQHVRFWGDFSVFSREPLQHFENFSPLASWWCALFKRSPTKDLLGL